MSQVLLSLDLTNNQMSRADKAERGVTMLCEAITRHGNIKKLSLARNCIKDNGGMAIGDMLMADHTEKRVQTGTESIQSLDVSGNCLTSDLCALIIESAGR
mgnify:CR=1 FL=1